MKAHQIRALAEIAHSVVPEQGRVLIEIEHPTTLGRVWATPMQGCRWVVENPKMEFHPAWGWDLDGSAGFVYGD